MLAGVPRVYSQVSPRIGLKQKNGWKSAANRLPSASQSRWLYRFRLLADLAPDLASDYRALVTER